MPIKSVKLRKLFDNIYHILEYINRCCKLGNQCRFGINDEHVEYV